LAGPALNYCASAARKRKPVSAIVVDEYNLKHALPKGYTREGDRFVFRPASSASAVVEADVQSRPIAPTVRLAHRKGSQARIAV